MVHSTGKRREEDLLRGKEKRENLCGLRRTVWDGGLLQETFY